MASHLKLSNFYRCTIESIRLGYITAWYGNCTPHNLKALQRVVRCAQHITRGKLPALQDTYITRCHRKAKSIIKDNNHPSHCLFTPLPSRRRGQYRCIRSVQLPSVLRLVGLPFFFQQYNDSKYTSRLCKGYLTKESDGVVH